MNYKSTRILYDPTTETSGNIVRTDILLAQVNETPAYMQIHSTLDLAYPRFSRSASVSHGDIPGNRRGIDHPLNE